MLRRRRYFISRLQYSVVLTVLLYSAMLVMAIAASVTVPFLVHEARKPEGQASINLANGLLFFHQNVWPVLVPVVVLVCLHAIVLSHRVVGPLYRFRRVMAAVTAGDLTVSASIRRKDLLRDEADAMNAMIARLARDVETIRETRTRLRGSFRRLAGHIRSAADEETIAYLLELERGVEGLETAVDRFRVAEADESPADATAGSAAGEDPDDPPSHEQAA